MDGLLRIPVPSHHYEEPLGSEEEDRTPASTITLDEALTKCYDLRWVWTVFTPTQS